MDTACNGAMSAVTPRHQAQFLRMIPIIERQVRIRCRGRNREQREEYLAEALALAWAMYVRLIQRRRTEVAFATPLADYACRQLRFGRSLGRSQNRLDVTSTACQRYKRVRVVSLDQRDQFTGDWLETIVEDRKASIPDRVALLVDYPTWLRTLPHRDRRIAQQLAAGECTKTVARRFHVTDGRISQIRRELFEDWQTYTADRAEVSKSLAEAG